MKYPAAFIALLVTAGSVSAHGDSILCGPYLEDQRNQAAKAATMEQELARGQKEQADLAADYEHQLSDEQKSEAGKSAQMQTELGAAQREQAALSADYNAQLTEEQKSEASKSAQMQETLGAAQREQAALSADYGAQLGEEQASEASKSAQMQASLGEGQRAQAELSTDYQAQMAEENRSLLAYYASLCDEQARQFGGPREAAAETREARVEAAPSFPAPVEAPGKKSAVEYEKPDLLKALEEIDRAN